MDFEPELCPREPRVGDIWLSPDLRYLVKVLRSVTLMPGTFVIRTVKARLEGIEVNNMPRLANLEKERYTWITAVGDDPVLLDHAADYFETGKRLTAGDLVVDMNGSHGLVAYNDKDVRWFVPSNQRGVYNLSKPTPPQWPITFVCKMYNKLSNYYSGLQQLGYMSYRGQMWRI